MTDVLECQGASVLVVEDDLAVASLLREYLSTRGFSVETATTAREMWRRLAEAWPAAILLDAGLPDGNGLDLVPRLRAAGGTGIIMLTAQASPAERCGGLDRGADDYISKPFHLAEVGSRLQAVIRRLPEAPRPQAAAAADGVGGWLLDERAGTLTDANGRRIELTSSEARLWRALAATPGVPVDRDRLSAHVRNLPWEPQIRAIDVLVARLRARVEDDPRRPRVIVTVRNRGYMLAASASA